MNFGDSLPKLGLPRNGLSMLTMERDTDIVAAIEDFGCIGHIDYGGYQKDELIETELHQCLSFNEFTFKTYPLSASDNSLMTQAIKARFPSGALRYEARPYTTCVNDLKLFKPHGGKVKRCRLTDIHTGFKRGKISLKCSIYLVDDGRHIYDVPIEQLFDFPQSVSAFREINDGIKKARLSFGYPFDQQNFYDDEINSYFIGLLSKGASKIKVRILGYKDGKYHVDILDSSDRAIVQHLREKFKSKFDQVLRSFEGPKVANQLKSRIQLVRERVLLQRLSQPSSDKSILESFTEPTQSNGNQNQMRVKSCKYHSSLHYFREKLKIKARASRHSSVSAMSLRLLQVKLVTWTDPDEFYIVPADRDYYANHDEFFTTLEDNQDARDASSQVDYGIQRFKVGQYCLCKNERDIKVGRWLRGKVTEVRGISDSGLLNQDGEVSKKLNRSDLDQGARDIFYKVLLIDYGLSCVRKAVNMRHITNERSFTRFGTWALRCRLFGLKPIEVKDVWNSGSKNSNYDSSKQIGYSLKCKQVMGAWLREKMLTQAGATFTMLPREQLESQTHLDPYVAVTLFYCFQPFAIHNDLLIPQSRRVMYQSLNSVLIEQSLVCNRDRYSNEPSFVELDEYVLNKLVPLGMIDI